MGGRRLCNTPMPITNVRSSACLQQFRLLTSKQGACHGMIWVNSCFIGAVFDLAVLELLQDEKIQATCSLGNSITMYRGGCDPASSHFSRQTWQESYTVDGT